MPDLFTNLAADKIISLLESVNIDLKKKEQIVLEKCLVYKQYYILVAHSGLYGEMYNVVTNTGEMPTGLPTNWRSKHLVIDELGLDKPTRRNKKSVYPHPSIV